jgi:hypothetical protein
VNPAGTFPSKKSAIHDLTCPPSCPHFGTYEEWQPRLYVVQVEDEAGFVFSVTVTAIGPHDACNQARLDYPDCFVRQAVPA